MHGVMNTRPLLITHSELLLSELATWSYRDGLDERIF
jgi:hypothetical protein